jgi:hypothetical protein
MGLEPTTFCMARGPSSEPLVAANLRQLRWAFSGVPCARA